MRSPGPLAGWAVHGYTASGAALAFLALAALLDGQLRLAFFWLSLQVAVDATDGWLARLVRVRERVPAIDGARLDDLVDFLTYVFVPACIVWHEALVPDGWRLPVALAMIVSSAVGFSRVDAKTTDHYFTGFPSYWNVVVFYLVIWQVQPGVALAVLLLGVALVFVPIRYVYPSRTPVLMPLTLVLGVTWGLVMLGSLWWLDDVPAWLRWAGLVFPAYYVILSLWLEVTRRR